MRRIEIAPVDVTSRARLRGSGPAFVAGLAIALVSLAGGGALSGCSHLLDGSTASDAEGEASEVEVARVGSYSISLTDVDREIKNALFEDEFGPGGSTRLHAERKKVIDALVDRHLLEAAAAEAGVETEAYLAQRIAALPPIDEAEIAATFEEARDRLSPEVTLEQVASQIRAYLEQTRRKDAMASLRGAADVRIMLPRERVEVAAEGPTLGPADAPITLIEFSDYQCPYCQRAEPTVRDLTRKYPQTVRLIYRHLPLDSHPRARPAAAAAVCAEAQGRFWEYHVLLFDNAKALGDGDLRAYALTAGLDAERFEGCLSDPATDARIDRDVAAAAGVGARGTPTFFLNGIRMVGAQPIEIFEELIDEELAAVGGS